VPVLRRVLPEPSAGLVVFDNFLYCDDHVLSSGCGPVIPPSSNHVAR
jgi:hypothetical protein